MRSTTIRLGAITAVVLIAWRLVAGAQPAVDVYRLGTLSLGTPAPSTMYAVHRGFLEVLRGLGFVEGRNLEVEHRYADGRAERLPVLATGLAQRNVDVIVAFGSDAVRAAQGATKTIPIVCFIAGADPVELGLAPSLARPGGNVTGVVLGAILAGKRLELLREAVPRATTIALLATGDPSARAQSHEAKQAAASLGVRLVVVEAMRRDYEQAFATMRRKSAEALFVAASPRLNADRGRIIELAARYRLPAIYQFPEHAEEGGLMGYGVSGKWAARRVAEYVDRILKGAKPAELPIEQATTLTLAINLKTAKALDLAFPQSVLLRADHLIE